MFVFLTSLYFPHIHPYTHIYNRYAAKRLREKYGIPLQPPYNPLPVDMRLKEMYGERDVVDEDEYFKHEFRPPTAAEW